MKNILMILLTASLMAACTPKNDATTTTTDAATTTTDAVGDAAIATGDAVDGAAADTSEAVTDAVTDTTDPVDNAADPGADSTLTNNDDAGAGEELDMAVGDGLEGTVADFDGTAQTFTLNENDANYAVTTSPETVYEGMATTAEDFFGTDRAAANIAVEGEIDEASSTLNATKITLN
ncbi:hypothetical protein [Deinococcus arenicola]|uniref:DUF5666 domain-containing protein n=1 Tax=Deinococcus arenicola TaxID=2994950 RepID=A0ABU4DR32_9DEIO|nr:hypothetical protein [Deinococcus sp. ZS9-10]MDV6374889.1 hypothetical protein [Deinococcus sp. ZS9-10]